MHRFDGLAEKRQYSRSSGVTKTSRKDVQGFETSVQSCMFVNRKQQRPNVGFGNDCSGARLLPGSDDTISP